MDFLVYEPMYEKLEVGIKNERHEDCDVEAYGMINALRCYDYTMMDYFG